jgi:hypothetical protein
VETATKDSICLSRSMGRDYPHSTHECPEASALNAATRIE